MLPNKLLCIFYNFKEYLYVYFVINGRMVDNWIFQLIKYKIFFKAYFYQISEKRAALKHFKTQKSTIYNKIIKNSLILTSLLNNWEFFYLINCYIFELTNLV